MNEKSPPPYRREEYSLLLLDMYPEAKNIIIGWLEDNLIRFFCESLAMYMRNKLGRKLNEKIKSGRSLTYYDFENSINLSTFGISTAHRYITLFGYRWCGRKKTYYSDKHESEENIRDRGVFINKYNEYERDAYLWVQVSEEQALDLEQNGGLLPGVAAHCYEGMHEYHIDTHPSFQAMQAGLSVRNPLNSRPIIIYGQDETVVKSNIFSSRCWHNPSGASELLPKPDGYSLMISAPTSRVDGLGARITELV